MILTSSSDTKGQNIWTKMDIHKHRPTECFPETERYLVYLPRCYIQTCLEPQSHYVYGCYRTSLVKSDMLSGKCCYYEKSTITGFFTCRNWQRMVNTDIQTERLVDYWPGTDLNQELCWLEDCVRQTQRKGSNPAKHTSENILDASISHKSSCLHWTLNQDVNGSINILKHAHSQIYN